MANEFTEAPASVTITIKTPGGFETLFTSRTFDDKELTKKQIAHLLNLEKALLETGFTPVVRGYGKPAPKPKDYVEGRVCPNDGARLFRDVTREGKKLIKCENNKWDAVNKRPTGCPFIEWLTPATSYPSRDIND